MPGTPLSVSVRSGNQELVRDSDLVLTSSGSGYHLEVTSLPDQFGEVSLVITADYGTPGKLST